MDLTRRPRVESLIGYMSESRRGMLGRCSEGRYFVVKPPGDGMQERFLLNEFAAGRLAELAGLTSPRVCAVEVVSSAVEHWESDDPPPAIAGPGEKFVALGSRLIDDSLILNYLPIGMSHSVSNQDEMASWNLFDAWIGDESPKRPIYRYEPDKRLRAFKRSSRHCLGGSRSRPPASGVATWSSESGALADRLAALRRDDVLAAFEGAPIEWTRDRPLDALADEMVARGRALARSAEGGPTSAAVPRGLRRAAGCGYLQSPP